MMKVETLVPYDLSVSALSAVLRHNFVIKAGIVLLLITHNSGCAQGRVDILNQDGEVLGSCSAEFSWHWYGAQDSVDYLLYLCAKGHVDEGELVSDPSIFDNDYSLPIPPEGETWNKLNAAAGFKSGDFSEQKYGYVLAAIEHEFMVSTKKARQQLESGTTTQKHYEKLIYQAEVLFKGE